MSHYSIIETEFRDEETLVETLEEMEPGWVGNIERHETAATLYDYVGHARPEKAHIIVRRRFVDSMSNDVGFVKEGNSYKAILSDYDQNIGRGASWLSRVTQLYAKNKVLKEMKLKGWRLGSQTTTEKGSIKLVLEV